MKMAENFNKHYHSKEFKIMTKRLYVSQLINSKLAVSSKNADIIFNYLESSLKNKEKVIIDFSNIETLTTAFLNIAIGKLYGITDASTLNSYLTIDRATLNSFQAQKIQLVMNNAKLQLSPDMLDEE